MQASDGWPSCWAAGDAAPVEDEDELVGDVLPASEVLAPGPAGAVTAAAAAAAAAGGSSAAAAVAAGARSEDLFSRAGMVDAAAGEAAEAWHETLIGTFPAANKLGTHLLPPPMGPWTTPTYKALPAKAPALATNAAR